MRTMLFIIILGTIGIAMIAMLLEAFVPKVNAQEVKHASQGKKKYDDATLFKFSIDPHPEQTKQHAMEEYKQCPPLRPDRFRRRIKMLWGIDINNYPENALLWFGQDYKLSLQYQTIHGFIDYSRLDPRDRMISSPPPATMYLLFREYLLYDDEHAYKNLYNYFENIIKGSPHGRGPWSLDYTYEEKEEKYWDKAPPNILADIYFSIYFCVPASLIKQMDGSMNVPQYKIDHREFYPHDTIAVEFRTTDMRNDILMLYIQRELKKGRQLANSDQERNKQQYIRLGYYPNVRNKEGIIEPTYYYDEPSNSTAIWENYGERSFGRAAASALSFLLQMKGKSFDKGVLFTLSLQRSINGYVRRTLYYREEDKITLKNIVENIRKNNYFGYTLLREFDNNLMREMPTLAKIGTSFQGAVKQANTLLYLEPFKESYSIDTLQTYETFTAYEMGHDDDYFVEVEKPVESPIAGTDGYAKIIDRTEIVHGYIEKSKVVPYTDAQLLTHPHFTDHTTSKKGVINDKDGYVNVRAERNTKSEVVDKLVGIEFVEYWQLMGNWYIVETRNGKRGFVYKDRIKENK